MQAVIDSSLKPILEALIFSSENPLSAEDMLALLRDNMVVEFDLEQINAFLADLKSWYHTQNIGFELVEIGGGWVFLTKSAQKEWITLLLKQQTKKRLSSAAIETLAIIAYKQPVTKPDIEFVRGVNCDYAIQKLLDKNLITIKGKSDGPGKPVLYGTSQLFFDYFGINDLSDLPALKDVLPDHNEIGLNTD